MTFTPWRSRAAACGSALLLAAAFPPLNWWPLALVALVPVLLCIWQKPVMADKAAEASEGQHSVDQGGQNVRPPLSRTHPPDGAAAGMESQGLEGLATVAGKKTPGPEPRASFFWRGFRLGWQFGFVFFGATLWWVGHVTVPGMLALISYLALYPALAMGIAGWLRVSEGGSKAGTSAKLLLMAGGWTGLEWVRSVALSGFPWNGLGVPFFDLQSARSLSAWTGVAGLSGLVLLISLAAAAAIQLAGRRAAAGLFRLGAVCAIAELACRMLVGSSPQKEWSFYRAALIQPNVTMEEKMSPDPDAQRQRYFDLVALTEMALQKDPAGSFDLIVWPESAVPGFFKDLVQGGAFTEQLEQGKFSLVTGADHEEWGNLYNSVAVMRGTTANNALHPKVRLVPFGEFIPFRREVPLFEKILGGLIPLDFTPGTSLEPMRIKDQPFSIVPLVCFEDTIGNHARKFIRPEPQVIVNVTNDNWFHQSPATEMHFANARWRAAELNRTLLRSANTGVTAMVSPQGGVQRLGSFGEATLTGWFHTGDGRITFYARHGDVFSQVAGALAVLGCGVVWLRRRRDTRDFVIP